VIQDGDPVQGDRTAMLSISLRNAEHTRSYSISALSDDGWEVKLEREGELTHHVWYHDWHRVERALAMFRLEVSELTASGWHEVH
jgi:hypothetical protein